jgi:hypothetical protein
MNYTTFRWTQGTTWNIGWSFPGANRTSFSVQVTNNNSTGDFYIASYSQFAFQPSFGGGNNIPFFIVNATTFSPLGVTGFDCIIHEYCVKIPSGQAVTLYFAASARQGTSINSLASNTQFYNVMLMYGKFAASQNGLGTLYAQTIPFIAVQIT